MRPRNERHSLPTAWLFVGPEGSGKEAVALAVAASLQCSQSRVQSDACGECADCRASAEMRHGDVFYITPLPTGKNENSRTDGPYDRLSADEIESIRSEYSAVGRDPYHKRAIPRARSIKVSSVRDVRRQLSRSADAGRTRVVLVADADLMSSESANAFLKTLEEPGESVLIILITSRQEAILPTVRSRCSLVRFDPLSETDIAAALQDRHDIPESEAALVAHMSEGSFSRARDLLDDDLRAERADVVAYFRQVLKRTPSATWSGVESLLDRDRTVQLRMLRLMVLWFRDLAALAAGCDTQVVNVDQASDLRSFLDHFPDVDPWDLVRAVEASISLLNRNANPQLVMMNLSISLGQICLRQSGSAVAG